MTFLRIDHLEKSFGANRVVKDFNLDVAQGEFISLLGPSGCGKTTVLRMVAGFETPTSGAIHIEGADIVGQRPNQRNIGMVFQAYALFPNMTVAQNVGFGLKIAGAGRAKTDARVEEMLSTIGLEGYGGRYPFQLSGGQQQRVALARALAVRPRVLLLDEPLSALDAKIRTSLRAEIRQIQQRLGITTIFVTHDQEEALSISDRVVVMNGGIAEQVGTPFDVYNHPATAFVASFVGTLSILEGTVKSKAEGSVQIAGQTLTRLRLPDDAAGDDKVSLSLRPESLRLDRRKGDLDLAGKIIAADFLGSVIRIQFEYGGSRVSLDVFNDPTRPPPAVGGSLTVHVAPETILVMRR
ncbi:spermidine/putrescine ABC transporter ATP-binding protein [Zhengella mangrovi]|uniref:Spermidine/putrescine ABC transporter ATP-binding protein n=1 Tax=Zhengella mangrovi TaxID=1982044 RepID=A0A2G1QGY3_9HYPH|nr:ABC transporter ATP-binding protein [Zhengella mangrovi]PHP64776.1 spermidine/putrescine ABC transporter ATP-binding protein [Zhengella mangrovi]